MNWKHFLRGLGTGIIFSALIMLVAYMTSGSYRISDEEIIERATKLGMVMEDRSIVSSEDNASSTEENNTSAATTEKQTTEATTEKSISDTEATTAEQTTTEVVTTETVTTEKQTEEEPDTTYTTVEITVSRGMSSEEIAKLVQDAGIIEDYLDFDKYLNANGYSNKLSVNTFELHSGMSYEEIAKELTKGDR